MYEEFNRYFHARFNRGLNKELARQLLFDLCDLLQSENVPHFLAFGTLLGAVRQGDFIDHDTDMDLGAYAQSYSTVRSICRSPQFDRMRFTLARDSEDLVTVMRDDEHVDIYFFAETATEYRCMKYKILKPQLRDGFSQIEFLGRTFNAVKNPEEDLKWRYGDDWRTPKRGFHAPR